MCHDRRPSSGPRPSAYNHTMAMVLSSVAAFPSQVDLRTSSRPSTVLLKSALQDMVLPAKSIQNFRSAISFRRDSTSPAGRCSENQTSLRPNGMLSASWYRRSFKVHKPQALKPAVDGARPSPCAVWHSGQDEDRRHWLCKEPGR